MSWVLKLAAGLVAVYLLLVLAGYMMQRRFIYYPNPERVSPAQAGLAGVEERLLTMPDGARVIAWYAKAKPGNPTLLYFHGNGGSVAGRGNRIRAYTAMGWGVYMMSYRGYGGSGGSPSEQANVADARIAYGALVLEGVDPSQLILYGESLGTAVAARIATERKAAGLVLEAPYTSIVDVAQERFPLLPANWYLVDRYETNRVLPQVHMPVLFMHGRLDGVIPFAMGQRLFAYANPPKEFVAFPNAGHSNLYAPGIDAQNTVAEWFAQIRGH